MKDLRQAGFSVAITSRLGDDFPDLLIGRNGLDAKVELKTRLYATSRLRKTAASYLTTGQAEFATTWKGAPVLVGYTSQDVIDGFAALQKKTARS